MKNRKLLVSGAICVAVLGGCGGGGGGTSPTRVAVEEPAVSFGVLRPVTREEELTRSLQSGLQGASYVVNAGEVLELDAGLEAAPALADGDLAGGSFSTTNLQEVGVDEADIVKYDGSVLYVVDYQEPDFAPFAGGDELVAEPGADGSAEGLAADSSIAAPREPVIRMLATDPGIPSAEQVSVIDLADSEFSVDGLYLSESDTGKELIAVGQTNSFVYWELFASDYYWRNGRTQVRSWDVQNVATPAQAWSLEMEGSLLTSRRIGTMLYVVTQYSPAIEGLVSYPQSEEEKAANTELIANTPLEDLLPQMSRADGSSQPLVDATDCMVPNEDYEEGLVPPPDGSLVTVTAIDLRNPDSVESLCLNTFTSGFYASTEALYITANVSGNSTLIHKILLADTGPEYRGSGEVPGYIGTSNPSFLMSEHSGDLRVVSSIWQDNVFPLEVIDSEPDASTSPLDDGLGEHRLSILRESADGISLETIASLPNAQSPQHIGKPGEQVYAARFLGDRAYVVTFEVIDPLYVLDLADPQNPSIAGELEIPGFSTLLQPLGENLLLGVGQHVPLEGENLTQGIKLALFDVGVLSEPVSLGEVIIGKRGTYSPALYDHHALTILEIDGAYRAALPIERYDTPQGPPGDEENPWAYYGWTDSALHLFDVDPVGGTLGSSGTVVIDKRSEDKPYSTVGTYNSRSVLHDNAVFFVNEGAVWSSLWGDSVDYSGAEAPAD